MSPQEKAKKLVLSLYEIIKNKYPSSLGMPLAKQHALIAVDEILKDTINIYYWQEVKTEIELL
jgi:hypothetical protein